MPVPGFELKNCIVIVSLWCNLMFCTFHFISDCSLQCFNVLSFWASIIDLSLNLKYLLWNYFVRKKCETIRRRGSFSNPVWFNFDLMYIRFLSDHVICIVIWEAWKICARHPSKGQLKSDIWKLTIQKNQMKLCAL